MHHFSLVFTLFNIFTQEDKAEEKAASSTVEEKDGPSSQEGGTNKLETAGTTAAASATASGKVTSAAPTSKMAEQPSSERSRRVYVGNLAWDTSGQDLKDHMGSTGLEVVSASILTTVDGRSKGCGIAEFSSAEDAAEAVRQFTDSELLGRQIFVREDREEQRASTNPRGHQGRSFSAGQDAKNRRVYVGNLSWDVAWQDLKDHMRQAGEVIHAEVITEYNGRSKGCGIVEFATEEAAQEAIKTLTDTELRGRMIFVREDRESSQGPHAPQRSQNVSVYVWNLSPETSWQDLKDHMRRAGNVDSATILTNAQGESVCCGVVAYQKPQEALRAIRELQGSELNGMPIKCREDRERYDIRQRGRRMNRGPGGGGRGGGRGGRGMAPAEGLVYVGNLAPETTWRDVKDHFRQCGDIRRAEVVIGTNGQSRGYGSVQFGSKADAEEAIQRLNGSSLQGRNLEVRFKSR